MVQILLTTVGFRVIGKVITAYILRNSRSENAVAIIRNFSVFWISFLETFNSAPRQVSSMSCQSLSGIFDYQWLWGT